MTTKLDSRAALYSALARAFADPASERETSQLLSEIEGALAMTQPMSGLPADRALLKQLRSALEQQAADGLSVGEEFTYLFHRQAACPPYESSYSAAGMGQGLADIAGFYRAFGVQISPEAHERVDHIGTELEFMALLCAKEAHASAQAMREQVRVCRGARVAFFSDHLGLWASAFAARLRASTRLPLFAALADVLKTLVAAEAEDLDVVLGAEAGTPVPASALHDPGEMACD